MIRDIYVPSNTASDFKKQKLYETWEDRNTLVRDFNKPFSV